MSDEIRTARAVLMGAIEHLMKSGNVTAADAEASVILMDLHYGMLFDLHPELAAPRSTTKI